MDQHYNYLIVGQGLAGTLLAYELLEKGAKVLIVDNPTGPSSSKVAAGIFNPITGKRFVKTWLADEIYPNIISYYQNIEKKFGVKFLNETPIFKPLDTIKEQNQIIELCEKPEIKPLVTFEPSASVLSENIKSKFGGLVTKIGGWLDTPIFLETLRDYFSKKAIIISDCIDYQSFVIKDNQVHWQGKTFEKVVFCEGYAAVINPYFSWLPFNAVKGEILNIKKNLNIGNNVLLKGIFVVQTASENFKVGATYNWQDKSITPTPEAREELSKKFNKIFDSEYQVLSQEAGIRPATIDRRPFLGLHPTFQNFAIFNGLGTKGVSLGPYFASQLAGFLINNKELMPEVNINRFSSLYLGSEID